MMYFLVHNRYMNIIGIVLILGISILLSYKRSSINYKAAAWAFALQVLLALCMLKTTIGQLAAGSIAQGVQALYSCAQAGSAFVFGNLTDATGSWGFIFAVKVLPIIVFFSACVALLSHFCVIQAITRFFGAMLVPLFKTSPSETIVVVANSFLSQTEAPLLIRNKLGFLTASELYTVMVSGMATISGAILIAYAAMGIPIVHLLTASVMAIPGSLLISKLLYPETEVPKSSTDHDGSAPGSQEHSQSAMHAIAHGTSDGLTVALHVGAALIAFVSLIALCDMLLETGSSLINRILTLLQFSWRVPVFHLDSLFASVGTPCAYLLGFTDKEAHAVGTLLATKISINEMVAYSKVSLYNFSERTLAIVTYVLCGFANISSIGIQISGIGALAPAKRAIMSSLGWRALLGATFANLISAMIIALIL